MTNILVGAEMFGGLLPTEWLDFLKNILHLFFSFSEINYEAAKLISLNGCLFSLGVVAAGC